METAVQGCKGRAGWVPGAKEDLNRPVSSALTLSLVAVLSELQLQHLATLHCASGQDSTAVLR